MEMRSYSEVFTLEKLEKLVQTSAQISEIVLMPLSFHLHGWIKKRRAKSAIESKEILVYLAWRKAGLDLKNLLIITSPNVEVQTSFY